MKALCLSSDDGKQGRELSAAFVSHLQNAATQFSDMSGWEVIEAFITERGTGE